MSIVIAERGQQMIDHLRAQGNEAINASAKCFDANPRRFNSSRQPIDKQSVCLGAWNEYEWKICHARSATEWLLEGKSLNKLASECQKGQQDWDVYNVAYEIMHNEPRTARVSFV